MAKLQINQTAICLIEIIDSLAPEDAKELMKYKIAEGKELTLKDQLLASYGRFEPNLRKEEVEVAIARIWARNALNIEKLRREKEFLDILKDPESYWKHNEQTTESKKDSAIIGTADASVQSQSFTQTKSRGGASQSYQERDIERDWDKSDEEIAKVTLAQPNRNAEAKEWSYQQVGEGEWQVSAVKVNQQKPEKGVLLQNPDGIEELAMDSITLSANRSLGLSNSTTNTSSGRDIRSKKKVTQITKTYIKAQAIQELQKIQSINWREKIINQFACLFKNDWTDFVCQ